MEDGLKNKYPYTVSYSWLLVVAGVFGTLTETVESWEDGTWQSIFRWTALASVTLVILIAIFETLSIFIPKITKPLITILLFIPRILAKVYVLVLKLLLKPAILKVIEEENAKSSNFILSRKPSDDDFIEEILNFNELKSVSIDFTPLINTYWRFGIKFSATSNFHSSRKGQNFPLFHLAKNEDNDVVFRTYYSEHDEHIEDVHIIKNYDGSKLTIAVDKKGGLRIAVRNSQGSELLSEKYPFDYHQYGQISAWGDGRDYRINLEIHKWYEK